MSKLSGELPSPKKQDQLKVEIFREIIKATTYFPILNR